jgi:hypothetical protein
LVNGVAYAEAQASRLTPVAEISLEAVDTRLDTGDVVGGTGMELVVLDGARIILVDPAGTVVSTIPLPDSERTLGPIVDFTGDGKRDIVLGAREAGSAHVLVIDGKGQTIADSSFETMIRGTTEPVAATEGVVYFTAKSALNIAPKIVGALDVADGSASWTYHQGPLPLDLSVGSDGTVAVATRGTYTERSEVETPYATDHRVHATILLDSSGELLSAHTHGRATPEGEFTEGAISGTVAKLVDLDGDGRDEVLTVIERVSSLYGGSAELNARTLDGELLWRIEGPEATDGCFGFYRQENRIRIAVAWSRTGQIELLDGAGSRIADRSLPFGPHNAILREIGDFDGDGRAEFLVTDEHFVYILSEELELEYSRAFAGVVQDAQVFQGPDDRMRLAVAADSLRILSEGEGNTCLLLYTEPALAEVAVDGRPLPAGRLPIVTDLAEGEHRIEARLDGYEPAETAVDLSIGACTSTVLELKPEATVEPDRHSKPENPHEVTIPSVLIDSYEDLRLVHAGELPAGYFVREIDDFVGDQTADFFCSDRSGDAWMVLNADLEPVSRGRLTTGSGSPWFYGDVNGDGKADFGRRYKDQVASLIGYGGDGRLLFDVPFVAAYDTNVSYGGRADGKILVSVVTGYLRSPRGIYGLRTGEWTIDYYYPTAGIVNRGIYQQDRIYLDYFGASNGAEITHDSGVVERDWEVFLHVLGPDGEQLPISQPLPRDNVDGSMHPFFFDHDGDGRPSAHFVHNKDSYYQGESGVYRFEVDGSIHEVYTGPVDDGVDRIQVVESIHGSLVSLGWHRSYRHDILSSDYEVVYSHDYATARRFLTLINLDGGPWEIVERSGDNLEIVDFDRHPVLTLGISGEPTIGLTQADLDGDGRRELILHGTRNVEVYSY